MTTGLWAALAAIAVALLFGGYRALSDGRFKSAPFAGRVAGAARRRRIETNTGSDSAGAASAGSDSAGPGSAGPGSAGRVAGAARRRRIETSIETNADPDPEPTTWSHLVEAAKDHALGERATLVQFSSAFCAPCRATRRVLADVAAAVPGVVHVEIDAEHHLEVTRRLGVLRTPTTLVLDGSGQEVARAAGAPRKEQVLGALP